MEHSINAGGRWGGLLRTYPVIPASGHRQSGRSASDYPDAGAPGQLSDIEDAIAERIDHSAVPLAAMRPRAKAGTKPSPARQGRIQPFWRANQGRLTARQPVQRHIHGERPARTMSSRTVQRPPHPTVVERPDMRPRLMNTTVTLALGASVLITVLGGIGESHRPPAGIRAAFELIATKSGRKKALGCQASAQQHRNQSHLKAIWRPSHSAASVELAQDCNGQSQVSAHNSQERQE